MKKVFIVAVREVHVQDYKVEAETKEEAIQKINNCEGEVLEGRMEYSHALESDTWTVSEEEPDLWKEADKT